MRVRPRVFVRLLLGIAALTIWSATTTGVWAAPAFPAIVPPTTTVASPATAPPVTINEFLPEERGLGDCISALPKPGCGSEARGGWRQTVVFLVILGGLGVILWRIVAGARKARRAETPAP